MSGLIHLKTEERIVDKKQIKLVGDNIILFVLLKFSFKAYSTNLNENHKSICQKLDPNFAKEKENIVCNLPMTSSYS